jgi:hypothetical protein
MLQLFKGLLLLNPPLKVDIFFGQFDQRTYYSSKIRDKFSVIAQKANQTSDFMQILRIWTVQNFFYFGRIRGYAISAHHMPQKDYFRTEKMTLFSF